LAGGRSSHAPRYVWPVVTISLFCGRGGKWIAVTFCFNCEIFILLYVQYFELPMIQICQ
jgi:hypothetical protein